jgi:hypothetical protein
MAIYFCGVGAALEKVPETGGGVLARLGGLEGENHYFRRGDALKPLVFHQLVAPKGL